MVWELFDFQGLFHLEHQFSEALSCLLLFGPHLALTSSICAFVILCVCMGVSSLDHLVCSSLNPKHRVFCSGCASLDTDADDLLTVYSKK